LLLSLDLRASLLRDLGRREEAIRAYEEALALGDRVSNALSLHFALFGLGELHSENDDRARALPFMLQAIEKVEDLRKRVKDSKLLANFDERYCAYYGQTIKMLLENRNHAEALQWIDHVRARSFHDELAQIRPEEEIIPITGAALRAEVARHLMADEALLEIWLDKGTSYTFTTYPDGTIEPEVYPSEKVDENEGWADLLRAGPLRTRSAQIMSAPFASLMRPRFEKYRCFYVVPHGIQFFLPIAVSRNANEHKYLCQSHEIVVLPSVPLLLASKRKHRHATSRALVIGDPDGSLPHAREEATLVGQLLKCPIMTDDATVDNVLETLNGRVFDVVHFACHYVHSVDPNRCGLVMAAGSILTLDRLAALRLQANLVCTASCWSGLTPFSHSNNMTGLNRMLFLAGVNTILSSTGPSTTGHRP
jgi:hypothetical protein